MSNLFTLSSRITYYIITYYVSRITHYTMKYIRIASIYLIVGFLLGLITGCHHPKALYQEPERSPLEQGRTFEQKHQYAKAEQQYERIDNIIVRYMALNHLTAAWDSVNANIIRSQESVNQQPYSAEARLSLAQDYYNKGLLCTRYTRGVVGQYPRDFVFGEQEFFFSEALRQTQKALQLQPDFPEAHLLIGEIYLANLRRNDALNELKRLIVRHPDFARGYYAIGKVYFDMKEYEKLERYLIRAIKLDPTLYDAYYLLGRFYLEEGWFDYAAFTFLEILRENPQDSPTLDLLVESCHELGKYYMEQEQYDQAIRLFQETLRAKSSYEVHQSFVLAQQKRAEAIAREQEVALEETETTIKETADVSKFKALLFADQSLDSFLFSIDIKDDAELIEVIENFKENKFQEGYDMLQAAPEKTRTDPYRMLALSFAQQQLGRIEEAKQTLWQLTDTAEAGSEIQLWAWTALRNMGEQPDADTLYRVLGVIIEVQLPEKDGVDVLAAYLDGKIRYINYTGKIIVRERVEGDLADLARKVIHIAQPIARDFPIELRRPPIKENNIQISLLTCGGIRLLEDAATRVRQGTSIMSSIFMAGTNLLDALLAAYNTE